MEQEDEYGDSMVFLCSVTSYKTGPASCSTGPDGLVGRRRTEAIAALCTERSPWGQFPILDLPTARVPC